MPNWLIDLIEQHSTIVLFRHVFPDMDALGSQLGFSLWLKNRYPQKTDILFRSEQFSVG